MEALILELLADAKCGLMLSEIMEILELEEMIKICHEYGKIAYITVRDQQIELCVDEVYRLLKKYDMVNQCIINSFTPETLQAMRRPLS